MAKGDVYKDPFENLPRRSMFAAESAPAPNAQEKLKRITGARAAIEAVEQRPAEPEKKRAPAKKRKATKKPKRKAKPNA